MIEEGLDDDEAEEGPKLLPVRKNGKVTADLEHHGSRQSNLSTNQVWFECVLLYMCCVCIVCVCVCCVFTTGL